MRDTPQEPRGEPTMIAQLALSTEAHPSVGIFADPDSLDPIATLPFAGAAPATMLERIGAAARAIVASGFTVEGAWHDVAPGFVAVEVQSAGGPIPDALALSASVDDEPDGCWCECAHKLDDHDVDTGACHGTTLHDGAGEIPCACPSFTEADWTVADEDDEPIRRPAPGIDPAELADALRWEPTAVNTTAALHELAALSTFVKVVDTFTREAVADVVPVFITAPDLVRLVADLVDVVRAEDRATGLELERQAVERLAGNIARARGYLPAVGSVIA